MFDETAKIRMQRSSQETIPEQLRQLIQYLNDVIDLLRNQQEVLRQNGMNLPSGSLDGLRRIKLRLDGMLAQIGGTQSELRQLRGLAETTALINSSLDPFDVLNQVIDKVVELTGAERGYIVLRNDLNGEMEFKIARGLETDDTREAQQFIVSNTIVNQVATTGEPVLAHNAQNDPNLNRHDSIVGFALRSILAVPLQVGGHVIGVVYCDNRIRAGLFKEHDLNLLKAFANQAAVAIQNARLFEELRGQLAEITQIRDMMDNIFTSIISGLITVNSDNVITAYNDSAAGIIGVPKQVAIGEALDRVMPALDGLLLQKLDSARQLQNKGHIDIDITLQEPEFRFWKVRFSPLTESGGMHQGVALVLEDWTESKQREAQMSEAQRYMPVALDNIRSLDEENVGGQERTITVLFADVRGFSTFSENLEPEALMEIINEYLGVSSEAIELFEGVVDKYMGDAVTGLFNTQLNVQEDHALRALRAALSMTRDVEDLHQRLPEDDRLFYGIGIHTGHAVLGSVGGAERREFSAIGDAIEFSKLLQENALKGEVIVSPETYELVKEQFEFQAIPPRKTKDRPGFDVMYKLTGFRKRTGETSAL